MMQLTRRALLGATAAAAALSGLPRLSQAAPLPALAAKPSIRPLDGVDNAEAPDAGQVWIDLKPKPGPFARALAVNAEGDVHVSPDQLSPDLAHLPGVYDTAPFALTPALLAELARRNDFALSTPVLLFGLRGTRIVSTGEGRVLLAEDRFDHATAHCVIGVWDRGRDTVAVFPASTVPNFLYMRDQVFVGTEEGMCNMLPTGLYRHQVGTHGISGSAPQLGAFRMEDRIAVRRAVTKFAYDWSEPLGLTRPYDNIHASGRGSDLTKFSSAGCQTIYGWYEASTNEPLYDYARFREAAGLSWPHPASSDGRPYEYMLLTGRDARLATAGAAGNASSRLRAGSSGPQVLALQQALTAARYRPNQDGVFGPETVGALALWQRDNGRRSDAIATPEIFTALKI